ncbi:MAG TPA: hypothetical protein VLA10_09275 [Ilumatobacter sp.]|nr:hypothetical protein [Ilumatobacter sp.]
MLRPASPSALQRLTRNVHAADRELDSALLGLGVLPPLDLTAIRACLSIPNGRLVADQNRFGHRLLHVLVDDRVFASIHHDGRVESRDHQLVVA